MSRNKDLKAAKLHAKADKAMGKLNLIRACELRNKAERMEDKAANKRRGW